jgi:hypothetical protein
LAIHRIESSKARAQPGDEATYDAANDDPARPAAIGGVPIDPNTLSGYTCFPSRPFRILATILALDTGQCTRCSLVDSPFQLLEHGGATYGQVQRLAAE